MLSNDVSHDATTKKSLNYIHIIFINKEITFFNLSYRSSRYELYTKNDIILAKDVGIYLILSDISFF